MRDLALLFAPTSIAVLGASRKPGKLGAAMARQLSSFPGIVSLVNSRSPDHGDPWWMKARPALRRSLGPPAASWPKNRSDPPSG
jgi:hypothetical protein